MECAKCQGDGHSSTVRDLGSWVTEAHRFQFHDKNGKLHDHKIHVTTTRFVCSHGHKWKNVKHLECWCGWPN
jgi:hypothetical protein